MLSGYDLLARCDIYGASLRLCTNDSVLGALDASTMLPHDDRFVCGRTIRYLSVTHSNESQTVSDLLLSPFGSQRTAPG